MRDLVGCALVGASNATGLLGFYLGLTRTDASVAHVVFALYPMATLLFLAARGEPIARISLARLALGLGGVCLLVGLSGEVDLLGVGFVPTAAIFYGLHLVPIQWRLAAVPSETVSLYVVTAMAVFMSVPRAIAPLPWKRHPPVGWAVVVVTALLSTVLALLLLFAGVRRIGSGPAALLGPVETLLTVLRATLFLGERLSLRQAAGAHGSGERAPGCLSGQIGAIPTLGRTVESLPARRPL